MGVRHHHGHQGAAAAGAGTGDIMGRLAWRHGRSRAPFRPWRAVHQPRVHHQGRGIRHASLDRHGRRLVRQRHGRERQRRVQDRARLATQALPGFEGPGIGDVPVGLVVELEASAPVLGLQDTGTDRNRVLCKPSGASRPTIRAEQKSGHISDHAQFIQLVTMQNHTPYDDYYPDNQFREADVSELSDDEKWDIDSYAKGVDITDQATEDFLNQLNSTDKPITVIFYGDHLPGVYNTAAADENNAIPLHETDYFIWSNQASVSAGTKLDSQTSSYTSSNYFMALAAEHLDAKVSPYLAMLTQTQTQIPAISRLVSSNASWGDGSTVYLDAEGNHVTSKNLSKEAKQMLHDYRLVQYDMTKGKNYLSNYGFFDVQ